MIPSDLMGTRTISPSGSAFFAVFLLLSVADLGGKCWLEVLRTFLSAFGIDFGGDTIVHCFWNRLYSS